jgi:putative aminopeptidase FrvX
MAKTTENSLKKLLQKLNETPAPSGYEDSLRELLRKEIKPFADQVRVDTLGNLIARKGSAANRGKRIMLAAHMDEVGLIASHIDEAGIIRFNPIGDPVNKCLPGGRVRFLTGISGVIAANTMKISGELPALDKMYVDVGASSRKGCPVKVGDIAVFEHPFAEMGNRIVARSMDNRAGVAVLIETMRTLKTTPHEIYFVFTTQGEVGMGGAATAAFGLDPVIGIAVDIASADDGPNSNQNGIMLGKGPAIQIRDPLMLADRRVVDWMIRTAEKAHLAYQQEVTPKDSTDARVIQLTRSGVAAGGLCIPCRYNHSPSEMIDYEDMQNTIKLLKGLLSASIVI